MEPGSAVPFQDASRHADDFAQLDGVLPDRRADFHRFPFAVLCAVEIWLPVANRTLNLIRSEVFR
jgi:hypothetical protein